ncbi:MAG TPA: hypothetical protein DCG14_10210 [Phycisphaerales bacterium]|nr:hypothetical protein [Phycisphaerales bacterium]
MKVAGVAEAIGSVDKAVAGPAMIMERIIIDGETKEKAESRRAFKSHRRSLIVTVSLRARLRDPRKGP